MLPLKNRLKKKEEFKEVFRKGRSFSKHFFIIKFKENNLSESRFAFSVPIKQEKKSAKRNKLKRVFREVVKCFLPLIKKNADIVFIIKSQSIECSYKEIKEEVQDSFKKINII